MSPLRNSRQERYCREVAAGKTATEAYRLAGYKPSRFNASRLTTKDNVASRIAELLAEAAEKAEIDIERTLRELAKIGFASLRPVITWKRGKLKLLDSEQIPDEIFDAIAEVWQTDKGVRVKMHSKHAALESILKQLERGKGADLAVAAKEEPQEPAYSGPGVVDAREAFRRYGPRDRTT